LAISQTSSSPEQEPAAEKTGETLINPRSSAQIRGKVLIFLRVSVLPWRVLTLFPRSAI
jgi:hypothetical protein